ncbi:MAG: carboxylating nicotinate-nucleotide diphosphorylase, partial [Proteobacteria bacterium]|nr:carboxylating nicotinate-nucleotide diphosphorylase [Pseudomonadota bacterium]
MSAVSKKNKSQFGNIFKIIATAIKEDVPCGDITSRHTVPIKAGAEGYAISRDDYVVSGIDIARMIYLHVDNNIKFKSFFKNGQFIKKGQKLYSVKGNARSILLAERTVLNIIGHMMGIATKTRKFVRLVKGTKTKILDTRKTVPGIRILQRLAVKDGGAFNHRFSLSDAVLVKENHISICGGIKKVLKKLSHLKNIRTEIEIRNLDELNEILGSKFQPDIIMLDNMSPAMVKKAVKINKKRVKLEVSGGVNEKTIRTYA